MPSVPDLIYPCAPLHNKPCTHALRRGPSRLAWGILSTAFSIAMARKVRFCPSRSCAAVRPESEPDEPSRSRRLDNARHAHAAAQKPARPGAVRRDDHARPRSRTRAPACPAAYPPQLACTSPTPTPPPPPPGRRSCRQLLFGVVFNGQRAPWWLPRRCRHRHGDRSKYIDPLCRSGPWSVSAHLPRPAPGLQSCH